MATFSFFSMMISSLTSSEPARIDQLVIEADRISQAFGTVHVQFPLLLW